MKIILLFLILKITTATTIDEASNNPLNAYVLTDENGTVVDYGGVRIGLLDLEFETVESLKERYNLSNSLIKKLEPYLKLRGEKALKFVTENPLQLNSVEFFDMNERVKKHWTQALEKMPSNISKSNKVKK